MNDKLVLGKQQNDIEYILRALHKSFCLFDQIVMKLLVGTQVYNYGQCEKAVETRDLLQGMRHTYFSGSAYC
jgi:hypothetical protein